MKVVKRVSQASLSGSEELQYSRVPGKDGPVHPRAVFLLSDLAESLEEELSDTLVTQRWDHVQVLEVERRL